MEEGEAARYQLKLVELKPLVVQRHSKELVQRRARTLMMGKGMEGLDSLLMGRVVIVEVLTWWEGVSWCLCAPMQNPPSSKEPTLEQTLQQSTRNSFC